MRRPANRQPVLAQEWHQAARHRLQGRWTSQEWVKWARAYISRLEETPWKRWCQDQVHKHVSK